MYAAMIVHPMQPGVLGSERERVLEASRPWQDFLRRQAGFRELLILGDVARDEMVAVSLWDDEGAFRAAFAQPDHDSAAAQLMPLFAAPTAPRFYEVLAAERRQSSPEP